MLSDGAKQTEQHIWRTASFCAGGECVEVAQRGDSILMRNSTEPHGRILEYTTGEWESFIRGVKAGEFDDLGG